MGKEDWPGGKNSIEGREKWSASIDLAWSVDPELDVLRMCVCDGMSLVKTLVKMVQGDRLQNSNRIVIAAVTGRPAAPTSQERGRSYCNASRGMQRRASLAWRTSMIPRFECKAKAVSRRDDRLMSTCRAGHHRPPLGVVSTLWMMHTSTRLLPQVSK